MTNMAAFIEKLFRTRPVYMFGKDSELHILFFSETFIFQLQHQVYILCGLPSVKFGRQRSTSAAGKLQQKECSCSQKKNDA